MPLTLEPLCASGAASSGGKVGTSSRPCSESEDSMGSTKCGGSTTSIEESSVSNSTSAFGSSQGEAFSESDRTSSPLSPLVQRPKTPKSPRSRWPLTLRLDGIVNLIREQVPNSVIVNLHPIGKLGAGRLTCVKGPEDFPNAFERNAPSFILVDGNDESSLALSLLRSREAKIAAAVILVVIGSAINSALMKSVPDLVAGGVDDVMMAPSCTAELRASIGLSLAKAKACRRNTNNLRELARDYQDQCHDLFWSIAHGLVANLPPVRPKLTEVPEERIGDVSLQKKLGRGQFGAVYVWKRQEASGAVKVISKGEIRSRKEVVKITTEYSLLRRLDHPHIVKVCRIIHAMQNMYLFMEFAGDKSLFQVILRRGERGLRWEQAAGIFVQLADGLAHCHSMCVAHCDLKPENIQVSADGCCKIVDFGDAVDFAEELPALEAPFGTVPFMSPEVMCLSNTWVPAAADVWSLGVVYMEILCGNDAFTRLLSWPSRKLRTSEVADLARGLKSSFAKDETNAHSNALVSIHSLCPEAPEPLVIELIGGMLHVAPEMRMSTADAVRQLDNLTSSLCLQDGIPMGSYG